MTELENQPLFADEFTTADQPFLAGLHCGDELIRDEKPAKKHVHLLTLKVHRENIAAQKVYQRYGFELLPGFEDNAHFVMQHNLALDASGFQQRF